MVTESSDEGLDTACFRDAGMGRGVPRERGKRAAGKSVHAHIFAVVTKSSSESLDTSGLRDAGIGHGLTCEIAKRAAAISLHHYILGVMRESSDDGLDTVGLRDAGTVRRGILCDSGERKTNDSLQP